MEKEFDLLVFIARAQPFHNQHKRIIDIALQKSRKCLVLLGSSDKARSVRNPFTFVERKSVIQLCYPHPIAGNGDSWGDNDVIIKPIRDKTYNDSAWIKQIQDIVTEEALNLANPGSGFRNNGIKDIRIGLIGASKDHTSYYLKMFPQWESVNVPIIHPINSTDIRNDYFKSTSKNYYDFEYTYRDLLPKSSLDFLLSKHFMFPEDGNGFIQTSYFRQLKLELEHIEKYKKSWEAAPYPVKHLTVDSVVEQSGHVLMVKRRSEPGKGLWALPGGHLEMHETMLDGAIRELYEETKIKVPEPVIRGSLVNQRIFDEPHRSTIGRVVTQGFHFRLKDDIKLPKVRGADDAEKAFWVPVSELKEEMCYDDHYHIITFFLKL